MEHLTETMKNVLAKGIVQQQQQQAQAASEAAAGMAFSPGQSYVTEKLYMLLQLYLQNKGWNPSVELLQCFTELKETSMLPSAAYLQMMASRVTLDSQGRLILRENGKIILPFEHFANAVMLKHMNGPHGLHLGVEATVRAVMDSYTIGREQFGMEREFVVEVVQNCPNPACRYYKTQMELTQKTLQHLAQNPGFLAEAGAANLAASGPSPSSHTNPTTSTTNTPTLTTSSTSAQPYPTSVGDFLAGVSAAAAAAAGGGGGSGAGGPQHLAAVAAAVAANANVSAAVAAQAAVDLTGGGGGGTQHMDQGGKVKQGGGGGGGSGMQGAAQGLTVTQQQQLAAALMQQQQTQTRAALTQQQQALDKINMDRERERERERDRERERSVNRHHLQLQQAQAQAQVHHSKHAQQQQQQLLQFDAPLPLMDHKIQEFLRANLESLDGLSSSNKDLLALHNGAWANTPASSNPATTPTQQLGGNIAASITPSTMTSTTSGSNSNSTPSTPNSTTSVASLLGAGVTITPSTIVAAAAGVASGCGQSTTTTIEGVAGDGKQPGGGTLSVTVTGGGGGGVGAAAGAAAAAAAGGQEKIVRAFGEVMKNMARMKTYVRPSMCKPYGKQSEALQKTLIDTIQLIQSLRSCLPPPHIQVSSWKNEDKHRFDDSQLIN